MRRLRKMLCRFLRPRDALRHRKAALVTRNRANALYRANRAVVDDVRRMERDIIGGDG